MISGGQAPDRIGPGDCRIPPRDGITLQATALRVIAGGQAPDRIGPDNCGIPPRGDITLQATALRVISGGQVPDHVRPAVNRQPDFRRMDF